MLSVLTAAFPLMAVLLRFRICGRAGVWRRGTEGGQAARKNRSLAALLLRKTLMKREEVVFVAA